jgi:RNA polymerase sigma factor (sigma-70 family)
VSLRLSNEQRAMAAGFARTAAAISRRIATTKGMLYAVDELRGVAFEALSKATLTYDPSHPSNTRFSTYAWRRVTGAVRDAVRKEAKRLSWEEALDAAEGIPGGGGPVADAEARLDAGTGAIMRAFAMSCACTDVRDGEARFLKREAYAEVERAIAALPEDERLLFELRHRDQLPWEKVAERLGISEKTARSRDAEIREKLRKAIIGRGRFR